MKNIGNDDDPLIFDIHDKFIVQGIGLVVSGLIKQGTLKTHETYLLGPDKTG
jgi:elongation factor 1-alpha